MALIRLGFEIEPDHPDFEPLRQQLLQHYADNIAVHTRLFAGMDDVLDHIELTGRNWGVVTNKPGWLTGPLLEALELAGRAACVVSGDTLPERKPDPAPMLHACNLAGSQNTECVYIGDAERDILAGRMAGMKTLVAGFGYIGENDQPLSWGADALLDSPRQIIDWLQAHPA
jgi:phosphoglycolate phosphatase